jgi:TonB family protein
MRGRTGGTIPKTRRFRRMPALAATAIGGLLAGCAGGGGGFTFHPGDRLPEGCATGEPPALEQALDVEGVRRQLSDAPAALGGEGGPQGSAAFSVWRGGSEGEEREPRVRTLHTALAEGLTEHLSNLIRVHLPPARRADQDEPWNEYYRIQVALAPHGTDFDLAPSVECEPRITNHRTVEQALTRVATQRGIPGVTVVRVRVETDGSVSQVEVSRSSGHPLLDQDLADVAARMRFRPGQIDGFPIPVWSEIPLTVRMIGG